MRISPPAVAVILPFRNAEPWLAEAVASLVTAAEGLAWQLLAVDDGSTDTGPALLQRLTAHWPPPQLQLLQAGGHGVSAARNLGIQATSAPLIAFLDADDRALPSRLRAPLAALAADPQLAHAHGGWLRVRADGTPITAVEPWKEGAGFNRQAALTHKAVLPSAWTLRRDALLAVGGFDPSLSHAEDVDLLLRLAAAGHRGTWIEEPLVRYRVHAGGASRNLRAQVEGLANVIDRHLQDAPPDEQAWAATLRYVTRSWGAWKAWSEGDPELALEVLEQALPTCPLPIPQRPVHFLEHLAHSSQREGLPFALEPFLASPFWRQARARLLAPRP